MKQKFFGFEGTFTIDDENGNPAYKAERKKLSLMKQINLFDTSGNKVAEILHRFGFRPTYDITLTGQPPIKLKQGFAFLAKKFVVETPGTPLEITTNFFATQYKFTQGGKEIASATKKLVSMADTFTIDVPERTDPVLILSLMAAVDMIMNAKKHR